MRTLVVHAILAILVSSCFFNPEKEFFKEVDLPVKASSTIDFFSSSDTVDIRKTITIDIQISSRENVAGYIFLVGGIEIQKGGSLPYQLTFDSRTVSDGVHDLTFIVYRHAKGESLASKLGAELYTEMFTRKAVIFNAEISAPQVTYEIVNGVLVIKWSAYTGRQFKSYIVNGIEITSQSVTELLLPDFVGVYMGINLYLRVYDEQYHSNLSLYFPVKVSVKKTEVGIRVDWENSPFVNLENVRVSVQENLGGYTPTLESNLYDKSVNGADIDRVWVFPYNVHVTVYFKSVIGGEYSVGNGRISTSIDIAPPYFPGETALIHFYPPSDSTLMVYNVSDSPAACEFLVVDQLGLAATKSVRGILGVSPNGEFLWRYDAGDLVRLNKISLTEIDRFHVLPVLGVFNELLSIHVASNNSIIVYVRKGNDRHYFSFDAASRNLLFTGKTFESYPMTSLGQLSSDGKRLITPQYEIGLLTQPNGVSPIESYYFEHIMTQADVSVRYNRDFLSVFKTVPPYSLPLDIPYSKNVVKIISNQESHVGVVYLENGFINVDFFRADNLQLEQTLTTRLKHSAPLSFFDRFYLSGKFFVAGNTFNRWGYHAIKINL